jgi:hypothetical protein
MDSVQIDRLQLDIRATAAHDRTEALKRRLRDVVAGQLADALAHKLDPHRNSGAQVFIDEIRIGCAVQSSWDDAAIAAVIADRLAAALAEPGAGSIAFRDRTEYVAAALVALADGVAQQRWYFQEFDGLSSLTRSQSLRTLLCDPSEDTVAALARLTASSRARILECIDDPDLARVLRAWRDRGRGCARVETIWAGALRDSASRLRSALAAALADQAGSEDFGSDGVDACIALGQLAIALTVGAVSWPPDSAGNPREQLIRLLATLDVPADWIVRVEPAALEGLASAIAASAERQRGQPGYGQHELHRTSFGGAFVLLVVAQWLGWPALLARALGEQGVAGARGMRMANELLLRIIAVALTPARAKAVCSDLALRTALGLAPARERIAEPLLRAALTSLPDDVPSDAPSGPAAASTRQAIARGATRLLAALGQRVPACAGSSLAYLRRNLLSMSASVSIDRNGPLTVCLGAAPLSVLLQLAGVARATIELPSGGEGRRIRLQLESVR